MKALLLALVAMALTHLIISQPSKPQMVGYGSDWLEHCRNGGGA